ncbi:hypothetical protein [Thermaerobacter composti]|uniref:Uncharacterized protein n=1 Tax=Thermaerobacter composti TaxID=554949 RepID=A0ABZ0QQN8_9FIRM|nr:hypothetical protein [Thermaerobacter composti]WPD19814.1 hypothetical protein Q5761_03920 [Thermaerobacter composti]
MCRAIEAGDWAGVEAALRQTLRGRRGPARERLLRLRGSLREHGDGIVASGDAPRLGAIEAEVFHVLARRMKRYGARWSERGADPLARRLSERVDPYWCARRPTPADFARRAAGDTPGRSTRDSSA